MLKVAKHIIEAYLIHKKLDENNESTSSSVPKLVYYKPLAIHPPQNMFNIQLCGNINNFKYFNNNRQTSSHIWDFLNGLTIHKPSTQYEASTWLELYILYRIKGNPKPIEDSPNKARARATVQKQLNCFKRTVRGIVDRGIYNTTQFDIFSPYRVTFDKYYHLGIKGSKPLSTRVSTMTRRYMSL